MGPPGKKKSPPLKWLVQPLADLERKYLESHRAEVEAWEKDDSEDKGPKPTRVRVLVQDVTTESLAVIHSENPRGLLAYRDELTAWVSSFNQYKGKGSDRQFWLSNASCASLQVDRKGGRESLYVARPLINVCGGLTPDNLSVLAGDDDSGRGNSQVDDGFMDRLVFAFPDSFPSQRWTESEVSLDSEIVWNHIVRCLFLRPMVRTESGDRSRVVYFTDEAKAAWIEWHDSHMEEAEGGFLGLIGYIGRSQEERIGGIWSKYRATCARIALIISRMRAIIEGEDIYVHPGMVNLDDLKGAIALTEYFKRTARKVLAASGGGQVKLTADEKACVDWFSSRGEDVHTFTYSNINDSLRRFKSHPGRLQATLDSLVKLGCIRAIPLPPPSGKPGRPPSQTYEINPCHTSEVSEISDQSQREQP